MLIKKSVKVLLLATFFSFLWGLWWGYRKVELSDPIKSAKTRLKVLSPAGLFSDELKADLLSRRKVYLEVNETKTVNEFLKNLYAADQKYDIVFFSSFLSNSLILEQQFLPLEDSTKNKLKDVSIDFLNLSFDSDNKYTIPYLWGVNGFLIKSESKSRSFSLQNAFKEPKNQQSAALLSEPAEVFSILSKLMPIVSTWVDTGQKDPLRKETAGYFSLYKNAHSAQDLNLINSNQLKYIQISNGKAADFVDKNGWKFYLAEERSNLWVLMGAIGKNTADRRGSKYLLELLLDKKYAKELQNSTNEAITLTAFNSDDSVPAMRKPSYIRALPMSRIDVFSRHEVYEPLFAEYMNAVLGIGK